MLAKFVRADTPHSNILGIVDDNGIYWTWVGERLAVPETVTKDWPDSGYYCDPFCVNDALYVLFDGGYIDDFSLELLKLQAKI